MEEEEATPKTKSLQLSKKDYTVYVLKNTKSSRTYIGVTNKPYTRLKQHNGLIKGGAKYTRAFKGEGEWIYQMRVTNLTKR